MKKKSFTRALASISAAVLLAVSLTPQTIPAMAAENSVSEGSVSQEEPANEAQPAAANEAQPAEANTVQIPEEQPEQSEAGEAETLAESNQGAENSQEASASGDSAATEEAEAEETADAEEDDAEDQTIADTSMETAQPKEPVTVTYEASEGGHVSKESETFVKGADSAALTGAEAEAEDGYEFVDWTEDGMEVSTDAVFVPDVTAIDADTTFTANFKVKEVEETWPAVDFAPMTMSDGTEILVSAPEGAFPAGVQMRASVVEPEQVVGAIAEATPDDDAVNAEQIAAYDISFYHPADPDTEIEPRKAVQVSFENLPLQDEVTKGSSLEVWHIDDSQAANAGDIEKQSTDGDVSVSIKAQSFSTYAIRAKAPRVTGFYTFNSAVDLSDNIEITPKTTATQKLSGTISVEIHEQEFLGNIQAAYNSVRSQLSSSGLLDYWTKNAYVIRSTSIIPVMITLPEGLNFQNVQTSSEGASLLIISGKENIDHDLPATVSDGNKLKFFLNFAGSPKDPSIRHLSEVLDQSAEDGVLRISAQYEGRVAEGTDEKNIRATVTGGNGFMFGRYLAVNVDFTDVGELIPSANVNGLNGTLDADILVKAENGQKYDTESVEVFKTKPGATISLAADVDVSSIKEQMEKIEAAYQKSHEDEIKLPDAQSTFTADITVPEGLTFPTDLKFYTLSGTSAFYVSKVEQKGSFDSTKISPKRLFARAVTAQKEALSQETTGATGVKKIEVTMSLRDKIKTYKDLYQKIHEYTEDTLRLVVNGIKVDDDAIGLLTVTGSVSGTMTSDATTETGGFQQFSFTWHGQQSKNGVDATRPKNGHETDAIQLTVEVTDDSMIYGDAAVRKSGDVAFDTEHDAVFEAQQGDSLDFEAALNVSSIRKTMERIRKFYSKPQKTGEDIPDVQFNEDGAQSKFILTLTSQDGLNFPTDASAYTLTGSDAFELKVEYPYVYMTLRPDYNNFRDLYEAIYKNTDDYIVLTIKGVKVADNAPEKLTASGNISGNFIAYAVDGNKLMDTSWKAQQDTQIRTGGDGTDYVLGEAKDSNPIQLTIDVSKRTEPVTPETPKTPTSNPDSPSPTNGTPSSSGETPSPVNVTTPDSEVAPANTAKVLGVSRPTNETVPAENMAQPAKPQKVLGAKREKHRIATGDDSQMMLYGLLALAAAAGAIIWLVRYRRRER